MKNFKRSMAAILLIAGFAFVAGELCAAAVEFGDYTTPRAVITGNFTVAGNSSPVTVRNSYSKITVFTSVNGVAATAQTIIVQAAAIPANPAMTPVFFNAVTIAGAASGKADTGTVVWSGQIFQVHAVLTPGPSPTPGATPGPTPASTDFTVILN